MVENSTGKRKMYTIRGVDVSKYESLEQVKADDWVRISVRTARI